jgi:hypothetical protein
VASFLALKNTLKKSGYKLDAAEITVTGVLIKTDAVWSLEVEESKQRFTLAGSEVEKSLAGLSAGARVQISGDWQTVEQGAGKGEVIRINHAQKLALDRQASPVPFHGNETWSVASGRWSVAHSKLQSSFAGIGIESVTSYPSKINAVASVDRTQPVTAPAILRWPANEISSRMDPFLLPRRVADVSVGESPERELTDPPGLFLAPIRTTSPGLTVYKGGGIYPRYLYTRQHLGNLEVERHTVKLAASYTPTSTLQLEIEAPYTWTSFDRGAQSGSGNGFGNVTLWGKYRFFRTLETWGDKQAAFRFGVELPTGKKTAPGFARLNEPDFVRQQLTPINNGWASHFDLSFSQAHKRLIYGANVEATARGEREGFRLGHEARINTDLEYVLLPFNYRSPTKELFAILETTYVHRGAGRVGGRKVFGSGSDEFYLAPGLQYIASSRFIIEASLQFPAILNTGPLILKTDRNFLFGVRYLY